MYLLKYIAQKSFITVYIGVCVWGGGGVSGGMCPSKFSVYAMSTLYAPPVLHTTFIKSCVPPPQSRSLSYASD